MQTFIDSGYRATLCGRVFNKRGRQLKPIRQKNGYSYYHLYSCGTGKVVRAHRFIWYFFFGEIPKHLVIDHKNSDKTDNRLTNLRLLTPKENQRLGNAKVTKADVLKIRQELGSTESGRELAKRYGISPQNIASIKKGRTWKDVY